MFLLLVFHYVVWTEQWNGWYADNNMQEKYDNVIIIID